MTISPQCDGGASDWGGGKPGKGGTACEVGMGLQRDVREYTEADRKTRRRLAPTPGLTVMGGARDNLSGLEWGLSHTPRECMWVPSKRSRSGPAGACR